MHAEVPIFFKVSENLFSARKFQINKTLLHFKSTTTYESSKLHMFFLSSSFLTKFFFSKRRLHFFSTCVRDNAPNYQQQISSLDMTFGFRVDPHNHIMGPNRLFTTSLKLILLKNELEKFSQYLIQFIMLPYLFFDQI